MLTWLLRLPDGIPRHEILGGVAKSRGSATSSQFTYVEDFDGSYMGIASTSAPGGSSGDIGGGPPVQVASTQGLF